MARPLRRDRDSRRSRDDEDRGSSGERRNKKDRELRPIKRLKNGSVLYSNGWVRGPVGRIMFVNFDKAKVNEDDDGNERESFGCATLYKPGEDLSLLKIACERFAKNEKGERWRRYKPPFREQDDKIDEYEGFEEGGMYFNTSSKYQPSVTGAGKGEIDHKEFYSGCYAQLLFRPYIYEVKGNKGVGLGLAAAQFVRDGKRISGGGVNAEDVFDEHESSDIDDDDGQYEDDDEQDRKPRGKRGRGGADEFL